MPGWEMVDHKERESVLKIFEENKGVAFAHGFDAMRKHYYVRELEKKVVQSVNAKYCQAVSSGSAGLYCALRACGVGPGDEVITSCFTFIATVEAIILAGATPVCVGIDESFNISPEAIRSNITEKTRCIIPVHMAGAPADMKSIVAVAEESGQDIIIIEDACQAMGVEYEGGAVGTYGDIGVYSLDAGKIIQSGEGGLVVTNNKDYYQSVRAVHDHGHTYDNPNRAQERACMVGFNFRMTELQGAYAMAQLSKLDYIISTQKANKKAILQEGVTEERVLHGMDAGDCIIKLYSRAEEAERVVNTMKKAGLGTKNIPDALNWHYAGNWPHIFGNRTWDRSEHILSRAVAIPVPVNMAADYPARIMEATQ